MYERLKHEGMVQNHKLKQMYFGCFLVKICG